MFKWFKKTLPKRLYSLDNMNNIGPHDNNTETKLTRVCSCRAFSGHGTGYLVLLAVYLILLYFDILNNKNIKPLQSVRYLETKHRDINFCNG